MCKVKELQLDVVASQEWDLEGFSFLNLAIQSPTPDINMWEVIGKSREGSVDLDYITEQSAHIEKLARNNV